jgi:branched-chain amino acid transport system ATP-binding protein
LALLEVEDLRVSYGAIEALRGVSLRVEPGQIVALIGANGAGKTTTLRAVSGMLPKVQAARLTFDGQDLRGLTPDVLLGRGLAHAPEGRGIFPNLTVKENLDLGAYLRRDGDVEADRQRMYGLVPILKERAGQPAGTLSGGEQQMLSISRALMSRPRLLLLDEPSFGLAPMIVAEIFRIMRRINEEDGVSMLVVEQNANLALDLAHQAYLLETGRVALSGTAAEIRSDESVRRAYLGY